MRARAFAFVLALCGAAPMAAHAQAVSGPYVSLGAGVNMLQDQTLQTTILPGTPGPLFNGNTSFNPGFVGVGALGWGFGNGLRAEIEGDYRFNAVDRVGGAFRSSRSEQSYGGMVNLLYDLNLGWPVTPYVGVGVGEQTVTWQSGQASGPNVSVRLQHSDTNVAYQGILGAAYDLPIPGLALTAEYRFMAHPDQVVVYGQYFAPNLDRTVEARFSDAYDHSLLIGLRYAFNAAPPATFTPAPMPPAPAPARTYLVFFDWDRADLTDRARQVIAEAAQASTHVQVTRIEVDGYTDRSGTQAYNQGLSVRRAQNVANELVRLGVPRDAIAIQGFGETNPLVPTAEGVREPQNRRVEIILRQ